MYIAPPSQPPSGLLASWPPFPGGGAFENNGTTGEPGVELPNNWSSLIGIVTAIIGNVLIALALNVQRYAHIQLERQRQESRERTRRASKDRRNGDGRGGGRNGRNERNERNGMNGMNRTTDTTDTTDTTGRSYGAVGGWLPSPRQNGSEVEVSREDVAAMDGDESQPLVASFHSDDSRWTAGSEAGSSSGASTSYLRSPSWWLGQVLITVGESGNFLAYGFAPASIVSPLGVVALISNCVIAPILFKERFRLRDFWGVVVAVGGAVTVVLSAKQEETKLAPHDVWDAITTPAFEIYVAVTCSLIALLMWASPRYGNRTILIDLGLVGLFGAYTVLATKGVSSMLSSTLFGAFMTPMTYTLIVILLGTAVMQVRYVNKALQRFDSTQVIPIQFVMFTLSVIIGSAVLYRDFERTTAEQAAKFVGGCLLTFFGVFIITSGRPPANSDDDDDDEDGSEAEIESDMLAAESQSHSADGSRAQTPGSVLSPRGSRRSSRASRVSFSGIHGRPFALLPSGTGVPSARMPPRFPVPSTSDSEGEEVLPLLENPWRNSDLSTAVAASDDEDAHLVRPVLGAPAISADSVLHAINNNTLSWLSREDRGGSMSGAATIAGTGMDGGIGPSTAPPLADRPVTPATSLRPYTSHFQSPMISPSPLLSSTVSTVMADTILKHMDGANPHPHASRRLSNRRQRQGLRSSLFVPQDELDDDAEWLMQPFWGQHQSQHPLPLQLQEEPAEASTLAEAEPVAIAVKKEHGRERTRSLSNTFGGLFWTRRKRRNTSPETASPSPGLVPGLSPANENVNARSDVLGEQDYTANDDLPPAANPA